MLSLYRLAAVCGYWGKLRQTHCSLLFHTLMGMPGYLCLHSGTRHVEWSDHIDMCDTLTIPSITLIMWLECANSLFIVCKRRYNMKDHLVENMMSKEYSYGNFVYDFKLRNKYGRRFHYRFFFGNCLKHSNHIKLSTTNHKLVLTKNSSGATNQISLLNLKERFEILIIFYC